jgi:pyruvate kinase
LHSAFKAFAFIIKMDIVKQAFKTIDVSGTGLITPEQFKLVFKACSPAFSEADVQGLLTIATRDGKVHYPTFLEWLWGSAGDTVARITYGQAPLSLPVSMAGLEMAEKTTDSIKRKCKIICTMGPSCWEVDKLQELFEAGMNIARLNFSHGDHEGHGSCVARVREAAKKWGKKPIAILLDTKGPEIRTGFFAAGGKVQLEAGQDLKLVTDYSFKGDKNCFAVTYEKLPQAVKPGNILLCADGSLSLKVKSTGADFVITEVMNSCALGERKNCNLPGVKVELPVLQEKDINDLVNFGIPQGVDFVAASFVQSAADVHLIRKTLGEAGKNIKIISKIENQEGLINFDEIVEAGDGIMVARGDLGMEIPPEKVFLAQKVMIAKCNLVGKSVITATQMLESMTAAPRPTRAEAGDVANAVLDGTDCVMLSGETAGGSFPTEAVTIMRRIVEEAEATLDYNAVYSRMHMDTMSGTTALCEAEATCSSAVKTAHDVGSPAIAVLTKTGTAARLISKYRPEAPILMGSTQEQVLRQANLMRGVVPFLSSAGKSVDDRLKEIIEEIQKQGLGKPGDVIVTVYGKDGNSNLIKMISIPGVPAALPMKPPGTTYCQCELLLPKNMGDLSMAEKTTDSFNRKCKILCTMGPSCWSVENLVKLIDAGMNVARLNFSHGDHPSHSATVDRIREADKLRPDKPISILLDTKGPEIRTGFFAAGGKIDLKAGEELKIVTDYSFKGDKTCMAVTYEKLPQAVSAGNIILCADGSLSLKVKSTGPDFVITEVMNDCALGERKNCNLPGVKVDLPVLQDKDKDDIVNFGIPHKVHFVAASFVQSASDVKLIRETLGEAGKGVKIISKIENQEGLINFDEICAESDGIMVARGDLGMEIPPEKVFLAQKIIVAKCNIAGKPVICATQMLESMTKAPRPTRAEAGDVANAILDGADAVMLSGETAGGDFPVEAVTIMRKIVEEAEASLDYLTLYSDIRKLVLQRDTRMDTVEAMTSTVVKTAADAGAVLIIVLTESGETARFVAKYRPKATILAVTSSEYTARSMNTLRGTISFITSLDDAVDNIAKKGMEHAKRVGCDGMVSGAPVVLVSEEREGAQGAGISAKVVKLITVP